MVFATFCCFAMCLVAVSASPSCSGTKDTADGSCPSEQPAVRSLSKGSAFVQKSVLPLNQVNLHADDFDGDSTQSTLLEVGASGKINVVSYNLYWWKVRQQNWWSQIYGRISGQTPVDLIGFQECEDVASVVRSSGLSGFEYYQGPKPNPAPLAWNGQVFTKIGGPGNKWVAKDTWGDRHLNWVRLRHNPTGVNILFANTHGPLGNCGNTVGNNWVRGVNDNKQAGDIVFVTGDYNCGTGTPAMNLLKGQFTTAVDGGIDQILTDKAQKESGGKRDGSPSDHPLIRGTFVVSGTNSNSGGSPRRRRAPAAGGQLSGVSSCAAFSQWPNVAGGVTCNSCVALVKTSPFDGRCDKYCQSFGHTCVAAAEEQENNCEIKYKATCSQAIIGTSDMLCACQGNVATTLADDRRRRAASAGGQLSGMSKCAVFSQWPNVAGGVTCNSCVALVKTAPFGGRCDKYCQSFGHTCVAAAEEQENNCEIKYKATCTQAIIDTSDMLCACQGNVATTPAEDRRRRAASAGGQLSGASSCAAFSQWPNVAGGVTCSSCTALVKTSPFGGRCDKYCQSFGHTCVAAAEEQANNCEVKYEATCSQAIAGTSDMLCACQGSDANSPVISCSDNNWQCAAWASNGECTRNPQYMTVHCKKSCNACR